MRRKTKLVLIGTLLIFTGFSGLITNVLRVEENPIDVTSIDLKTKEVHYRQNKITLLDKSLVILYVILIIISSVFFPPRIFYIKNKAYEHGLNTGLTKHSKRAL